MCRHNKNYDPQKQGITKFHTRHTLDVNDIIDFSLFLLATIVPVSRKRKRDEGTAQQEGPAAKKKGAPPLKSVRFQDIASESTSDPSIPSASTSNTRSTTATIRSAMEKILSENRRAADRLARASGKRERQKKTANPASAGSICKHCAKNNSYDPNNPHTSRRSPLCPGHSQNIDEYILEHVGQDYERFVVKTGLENALLLGAPERQVFLRLVSELAVNYRLIAVKSQLFASYYIRYCLANNLNLTPIIFDQAFFYACIQKVLRRTITNTNINLPRNQINQVFQRYNLDFLDKCFVTLPTGQRVHSNALAILAKKSATNMINHVTETYPKRLKAFIKIQLKESFVSPFHVAGSKFKKY